MYWGPEKVWLDDERYTGDRELEEPLGAVQMGLIYVNPEGPNGNPDPIAAARDIRETFRRMAMNDEETVALIAGGHTFGKTHGDGPADAGRPRPRGRADRAAGPRLEERPRHRQGRRRDHQRPRGHLDHHPTLWTTVLRDPLRLRVGAVAEPGRSQPVGAEERRGDHPRRARRVEERAPTMLTTDLSLRVDPAYEEISRRFLENPDEFADAFARAWFKLTHRDMGPVVRYLGPEVPSETLLWQDPLPAVTHELVDAADVSALKAQILASDLNGLPAGLHRVGGGVLLPRQRQARRCQRRAHPSPAAGRLGGQRARPAGAGAAHPGRHPGVLQRRPRPAASGSRSPT